jgi:hypothetical protein
MSETMELNDEINKYKNAIRTIENTSFEVDSVINLPKFFIMPYQKVFTSRVFEINCEDDSTKFIYTKEIDNFYQYLIENIKKLNEMQKYDDLGEHSNVYLTGYEGSGKSTCLEVCAALLKVEQLKSLPNLRVFYIHDIEKFILRMDITSMNTFLKELLLTFDQDKEFKKNIENLLFGLINKVGGIDNYHFSVIIDKIEEYIKKNNIIFISIWDQVNICYDSNGELKKEAKERENNYYPLPAYYHYYGLFPFMRNQINICGASFNYSANPKIFSKKEWHHYSFLNSFELFENEIILLKFFSPFEILFNKLTDDEIDLIVDKIKLWTNMIPLAISSLSNELRKNNNNINNLQEFDNIFDSFVLNEKNCIKVNHDCFRRQVQQNEHTDDLKKYVLYMMMDLPIIESSVMKNYMDQKYMYLSRDINTQQAKFHKISPMNYLAWNAFHEYYDTDHRFFTSTYVNDLFEKLYNFDMDYVTFGNCIESLIGFYFKTVHFAAFFFNTKVINYLEFTRYQFNHFSFNDFRFKNGLNILIPKFNLISFDFIIINKINGNQKLTFIQCSTSANFYTHMINSMRIFYKNIAVFKKLFNFADSDFVHQNIKFVWILDKRQIQNISSKQIEVVNWKNNKLKTFTKVMSIHEETENDSLNSADENKLIVFKDKKHEYFSFEDLGNIFNSNILKNYLNYKDNLNEKK